MGKHAAVAWLAGAALVITSASLRLPRPMHRLRGELAPRGEAEDDDDRDGRRETDRRRLDPGTHRAGPAELAVRNRVALEESQKLQHHARLRALAALPSVPATTWVSLGPTDARNEFNGVDIPGVDSGRPNTILVDPRDPNVVYVAVSGGGVWKTFNFLSAPHPTWSPATDTLPNLAVGALAMDPASPDTLYLGNGDFVDGSGNTVLKSVDGGSTWGTPVALPNRPLGGGVVIGVGAVRALAVRGSQVLAGTDIGLYASNDGGATFMAIDLPNARAQLTESIWSILPTGGGHWVASGVHGCDPTSGPPPLAQGVDPGQIDGSGARCTEGANGEIWVSGDGVNWTRATTPMATGIGRITLAAGPMIEPTPLHPVIQTVVYAYVGSTDGFKTLGFWRSRDGGASWVNATGTLPVPSAAPPFSQGGGPPDCEGLDLGHEQTWYNQAIIVDPTNADHVVAGGNLCGARTLNGTAPSPTWELISHWLPNPDFGATVRGVLPYVHADWHTATSVVIQGAVKTFAGSDGGVFTSDNLFTASRGELVNWTHHNTGLVTHLIYALGSGDPVNGDPFVLFAGLQDNGTRYRVDPATPSVFNQPIGGDGIGATVHHSTTRGATYWASVEFAHGFCRPSATVDCADGNNWNGVDPMLNPEPPPLHAPARSQRVVSDSGVDGPAVEDSEPFLIHYANVETDTTGESVLTHSNGQIFVSADDGAGGLKWIAISQDVTPQNLGFSNVAASRTIPGLYGASGLLSTAPFFVTTQGNTMATWTVAKPVTPAPSILGLPPPRLTGASSIDFPPVTPVGKTPGQVFIGAFAGIMNNGVPPPDDKGRLWRTTDAGQTWTSIVGADPAHRLPNVPVYVVKYDPVTPTTIYAGTDLGVYISTDDAATWNRMGEGFPMVPARDIYVARNQDFIRVATYGRGLWEIYPSAAANQGTPGNGDYDHNLRLDWVDLGAMASRLGATPATTTAPLYSWILDMAGNGTSPTQQIDDTDLTALLGAFGGLP